MMADCFSGFNHALASFDGNRANEVAGLMVGVALVTHYADETQAGEAGDLSCEGHGGVSDQDTGAVLSGVTMISACPVRPGVMRLRSIVRR